MVTSSGNLEAYPMVQGNLERKDKQTIKKSKNTLEQESVEREYRTFPLNASPKDES